MKTAAIYARVSTADQVRGTSLDGQVESCTTYAQEHGYKVVKVVREDMSGATLARPGLESIRDMVAAGDLDALIVFDPDRLSRSLAHLMLLTEEFEQRRADLVFVNAPREETPEGRMLFGMRGLFAEYERTKIAERTRRGKERRAREGRLPGIGAGVPFGYTFTPGDAQFEVLESEAQWVRQIFEWLVLEGCSLREITRRLDNAAVPTKRQGVCWHRSTVQNILRNSLYCGDFYWNKTQAIATRKHREGSATKRAKSTQVARPREEWIKMEAPAIVNREIFEGAQRKLRHNQQVASGRRTETPALFKGLLVCAQCNRRLGAHTVKRLGQVQYNCPGRLEKRFKDNCRCSSVLAHILEGKAWEKLLDFLSDKERVMGALATADKLQADERRRGDTELEALIKAEQDIKRERNRLLDLHLAEPPLIDLQTFKERAEILDKKQRSITEALQEARERVDKRMRLEATREAVAAQCDQVAQVRKGLKRFSFEEKRMFLEGLELRGRVDGHRLLMTGIFGEIPVDLAATSQQLYTATRQPGRGTRMSPLCRG